VPVDAQLFALAAAGEKLRCRPHGIFYQASGYSENDGDFPSQMAKADRALAEMQ
jgi:hypothetical protein